MLLIVKLILKGILIMCRMASFFHNPITGEILVYDLNSHSETEKHLKLSPKGPFREGHYLPNGTVECRVVEDEDSVSQETCNKLLKSRFPTFLSFFRWAIANGGHVGKDLDLIGLHEINEEGLKIPEGVTELLLNSLKSAEGLEIPESVTWLSLNSLESAEGLEIPESVTTLSLNGLESAEGLKIPKGVKYLSLDSLKSAEGLEIPKGVTELSLYNLKSAEGLEIPKSVTWLWLNSLKSAEGLKIPEGVEYLNLDSLKSAEGLSVDKNTDLYAPLLSDEERYKIKRI
jgi:hypothetical protein